MNTLRHNLLLVEKYRLADEHRWDKVRYIGFANYNSSVGMSGKQAFSMKRPTDLFELSIDKANKKEYKRDDERAIKALNKHKTLKDGWTR